ncbi:hypothetical protein [Aureliella helgolandensis]|uniref:Uncharacterized protein n=1 Tax=Aureliella helgolandensis TaxID=2527968 RepID=A0A518GDX8_9BACT|nr:hypothetical protein [Aureliella helgolandensis]QDV26804.1 hypothetical protein Q31a_51830 [Aureliella helgolandensis]
MNFTNEQHDQLFARLASSSPGASRERVVLEALQAGVSVVLITEMLDRLEACSQTAAAKDVRAPHVAKSSTRWGLSAFIGKVHW